MLAIWRGLELFKRCFSVALTDHSVHQRQHGQRIREWVGFRFRYGLDRPAQPMRFGRIDQEAQDKGVDGSHLARLKQRGLTED